MSRKRSLVIIGCVVGVGLAALVVLMLLLNTHHANSGGTQPSTAVPSAASHSQEPTRPEVRPERALTAENVRLLTDSLNSSDKTQQSQALVPVLRDSEWAASAVLPAGSRVVIQPETFEQNENGDGQVQASVSDPYQGAFMLQLAWINNCWYIYATQQK